MVHPVPRLRILPIPTVIAPKVSLSPPRPGPRPAPPITIHRPFPRITAIVTLRKSQPNTSRDKPDFVPERDGPKMTQSVRNVCAFSCTGAHGHNGQTPLA